MNAPEIAGLFAALKAHAPRMAGTTAAERRERLHRLRRAIVARRDAIAAAIHADLGRPASETELTEIHVALGEISYAIRRLPAWMKPERAGTPLMLFGTSSRIVYEPRGVVLIMAPWNYPFILLIAPLVAAIAAGNVVLCKPSEKAPHTAAQIAALLGDVFDPAEVAVVQGGPDVARALLEQPFDHICFTGSTAIGRVVMTAAAKHLASVTLELGGKSPAVIGPDADIAAAADRVVLGRFMNAGQTCIAPDHVLVHRSREREFIAAAKAALDRFFGATAAERRRSPDYARVVDEAHARRLAAMIEGTVASGATLETGGEVDAAERYVAPTILSNVAPDSPVMADEIFGPVLPVLAWDTPDDVVAQIRRGGKPLAMYVFMRDRRAADALLGATSAGATVFGNVGMHHFHHGLPFGGVNQSGLGSYHGVHGFKAFSHARAVVRQREPALIRLFFPPYRGRLHSLGRRMLSLLERIGA